MTKAELIEKVQNLAGMDTKAEAQRAVEAVFDGVTLGLKESSEVRVSGFGTFKVKKRGERQGRNPQTGAALTIAARNVVSFKPATALKDAVN